MATNLNATKSVLETFPEFHQKADLAYFGKIVNFEVLLKSKWLLETIATTGP